MMRLAVLPILLGMGLVQPAQALDFHPTQSVTLNWIEPGIFQFDNFTIPVGVTVALPVVEAGLTAPKVYFAIAGDVLLEGSLLARGWDVSMNFNGSFVSTPSSLIQSHSLVLNSLVSGQLQLGALSSSKHPPLSPPPSIRLAIVRQVLRETQAASRFGREAMWRLLTQSFLAL